MGLLNYRDKDRKSFELLRGNSARVTPRNGLRMVVEMVMDLQVK